MSYKYKYTVMGLEVLTIMKQKFFHNEKIKKLTSRTVTVGESRFAMHGPNRPE